jgi:uncharacterized membrane protein YeaQ/YmgE (transglycosylase-associated protein family)
MTVIIVVQKPCLPGSRIKETGMKGVFLMMTLAAVVLADISLESLLWWIVVGLIAGFLASLVVRGVGYGILGDIIAGIVGAFIGGWLFGVLGISTGGGLLGSIIMAFIGAVIFIVILRAIAGMPRRGI